MTQILSVIVFRIDLFIYLLTYFFINLLIYLFIYLFSHYLMLTIREQILFTMKNSSKM